jgi:hypothetical protein
LHSHIQRCLWCSPFLSPQFPSVSLFLHFTDDSYKPYNVHIPLTIIISNTITPRPLATVPERIIVSGTIYYSPFVPTSKIPKKLNTHIPRKLSENDKVCDLYSGRSGFWSLSGHRLSCLKPFVGFLNPYRRMMT